MQKTKNVTAIIVAAGKGSRMGKQPATKPYLKVKNVPVLVHTLRKFEDSSEIDEIILAVRPEDRTKCEELLVNMGTNKNITIVEGGAERQDSVFNCLLRVDPQVEIVVVHDAARMLVSQEIISATIKYARKYGICIPGVPANDTMKRIKIMECADDIYEQDQNTLDRGVFVAETPNVKEIWHSQTPQAFKYEILLNIHQKAREFGIIMRDDAILAEYFGHQIKIVYGSYKNIKITTSEDLIIADAFLTNKTDRK
jgi:2-C-methyl-D-erythritol 4-phosphate cytidylyltransferase